MGVYIKGMDMPEHCYECLLRQGNCCLLLYEAVPPTVPLKRLADCPLIEIDGYDDEIKAVFGERRADEDGDRMVETAPVRP